MLLSCEWRGALSVLSEAIRLAPEEVEAYNLRASVYYGMGEMANAMADAHKVIELAPDSPAGWVQRGRGHAREGHHGEAIQDYSEAARLSGQRQPASVIDLRGEVGSVHQEIAVLFWRAECYSALLNYDHALDDFNKVLDAHPAWPAALRHRGWIYRIRGDYVSAVEDFTSAIALNSEDLYSLMERAAAYFCMRMTENALSDCKRAVELAPANSCARIQRAYGNWRQGNYSVAIDDYTEAIRLDADDAACGRPRFEGHLPDANQPISIETAALAHRAECRAALDDHDGALCDADRLVALHPFSAFGFARRARVLRAKRDFDRAWADCATALSLDPNCSLALTVRGSVHSHFHRDREAVADFTGAIELDARNATAFAERGLAYYRLKEFARAIEDYNEAIRLSPRWAGALEARGRAYFRQGEWRNAIEDFTSALKIYPTLKRARQYRSFAREAIGDYAGAARDRLAEDGIGVSEDDDAPPDDSRAIDGDRSN